MCFRVKFGGDDRDRKPRINIVVGAKAARSSPQAGGDLFPLKGQTGQRAGVWLYEEAASFSPSTFTLDIDGKPRLVLQTKRQAEVDEICRASVQARWGELSKEGPYVTELPPAIAHGTRGGKPHMSRMCIVLCFFTI